MIKLLQFNNIISPQPTAPQTVEGLISLKLNQLLTAKILEIFPDQTAKILYNGHTIHAKLEAPLTKGNRYLFEVAEKNGTVILKKIDVDAVKSTNEQILHKLNLPPTENQKRAVDFAVSEKIPITKENIKQIAEILQLTSALPLKEKKEVIHRMLQLQLPAQPATVNAVAASIVRSTGQLEMKQLYESLIPIMHKDKSLSKMIRLLEGVFGFQNKTAKSDHAAPLPNHSKSDAAKGISELSAQNPKPALHETKALHSEINNSMLKETNTSPVQGSKFGAASHEIKRHPASGEFLQAVEKWFKKSGLFHERNIFSDPVQLKEAETLKSQLLLLQQNSKMLELPENVLQKVDQALNKLTSQQIQNISSNDAMQQYILQIPFGQQENPKEIIIRWEGKKPKGQTLDPDHCRLLFWLEMNSLNDVAVDVQIQNRILSLKIFSDHPFIEQVSGTFVPSLKKSLNEMNYTLSSITFTQKPKSEMKSIEPVSAYKGMDLRI